MCAQFAPVCPIWLYKQLDELDILGPYHLLLAHDVIKQPEAYEWVFGSRFRKRYPSGYIIMDNSMIELGKPADDKVILEACEIVTPDVVVLPDYAHDIKATLGASAEAAIRWYDKGVVQFMGVAQGNTIEEYYQCAVALSEIPGTMSIGIPRNIVQKLGTRFRIARMVRKFPQNIHMLGFSDDVMDDITCACLPFVRGIDSAVPLRAGLNNVWLSSPYEYETYKLPRMKYWENEQELTPAAVQNLQRVRAWLHIPL